MAVAGAMIVHLQGDLFRSEVEALVNPVNCEGVMGRGLALRCLQLYPEACMAYVHACRRGEVVPGRVLATPTGRDRPRYLVHFPTKRSWRLRPRLGDIAEGLASLVSLIRALRIASVAVPALGCGLGGLDWRDVRSLIEDALAPLTEVQVLVYAPLEGDLRRGLRTAVSPPRPAHPRTARPES